MVFSTNPDFHYESADEEVEIDTPDPSKQKLLVGIDRRNRGGKTVTLVSGFVGSEEDLKALGKELKVRLGVGGSAKDGEITVQGDFRDRVVEILHSLGYTKAKRSN